MEYYTNICIVLLLSFVVFYINACLKTKSSFQILQSSLDKISDNTLYEKFPIVIEEQVVDSKALLNSLFKYQFTFSKFDSLEPNHEFFNNNKFLILHNRSESTSQIIIKSPSKKYPPVNIDLPSHYILIVPYKWSVLTTSDKLHTIMLNDFVHYIFGSSKTS